jgi:uncharacterized membrane protein YeiH
MNTLIKTIEILGIIAFALTGIYQARKKGMDIVGVYFVSMITAFGGGSLRDIILDRRPLFWAEHYWYPFLLLVLSVLSIVVIKDVLNRKGVVMFILVLDALGLGLFSASGASLANAFGYHVFVSVLIGVTTGVFGGVMRDIICNEIPYVFTRTELYATCAFVGALTYLLIVKTSANEIVAVISCISVTFLLRMLAIRYNIRLPI